MNRVSLLLLCSLGIDGCIASAWAQDSVQIRWPTNGTVFLQPTNVPLSVQIRVSVSSYFSARTDIYDGTNYLGFTNLDRHQLLQWDNVSFGEHELVAVHHVPSGPITSSVVRVQVEYGGHAVVRPGSDWHYRDGGVDLGTAWRGTDVDISEWPVGPAKLGFGDDDVETWLADWFNPTTLEVYPTYYFRHAFTVPNPLVHSNMAVRLRRDDGAIVYLNGEELFRDNMPEGEVDYLTLALRAVDDEYGFVQRWINPQRIVPGTNYLAVEIHNYHPHNEDIGFDLGLIADIPVPPPSLTLRPMESSVLLSWPESYEGYGLESVTTLAPDEADWKPLDTAPTTAQGQLMQAIPVDGVSRFFRLSLQ